MRRRTISSASCSRCTMAADSREACCANAGCRKRHARACSGSAPTHTPPHAQKQPPATSGCGTRRVALLLVGLPGAQLDSHLQALTTAVLPFLGTNLATFVVSEPDDALFSLSKTLGASLRALGLVARPRAPRPTELPERVRFVALDPPRTDTSVGRGQWHKFAAAWRLMEESEAAYSTPFELVVRLRLDATPLDVFDPCSEVDTDDGLTVHAATETRRPVTCACRKEPHRADVCLWAARERPGSGAPVQLVSILHLTYPS